VTAILSNALHCVITTSDIKFTDYIKLEKLTKIKAFCQRYINIAVRKLSPHDRGNTTSNNYVKLAQRELFSEEIQVSSTGKSLSPRSKIYGLNPFQHGDNILCDGGRLALKFRT